MPHVRHNRPKLAAGRATPSGMTNQTSLAARRCRQPRGRARPAGHEPASEAPALTPAGALASCRPVLGRAAPVSLWSSSCKNEAACFRREGVDCVPGGSVEYPHHYSVVAIAGADGEVSLESAGLPALTSAAPAEFGGPG